MTVVSKVGVSLDAAQLLSAATRKLLKTEVLVGIPGGGARNPEPKSAHAAGIEAVKRALEGAHEAGVRAVKEALSSGQADNALIGYVQEFGDDAKHIPPRPFLIPGVQDAKDKIAAQLAKAGRAAMDGNDAGIAIGFEAAGVVAQNAVRAKITEGPFTPLSARTLQARRAKGRTGEKPLIDTGALRQSITYAIVSKGDR